MQKRLHTWMTPVAGLAALWLTGCSGGSGDPNAVPGTSGDFLVLRTTPPNNGKLFLNEPIRIDFSNDVDLATADLNTVSFAVFDLNLNPVNEQPAGVFSVAESAGEDQGRKRQLVFSPRFPTNNTFDDGGFRPGRQYFVSLVGGDARNQTVLRDRNGKALKAPISFVFRTSDGSTPAELFRDTKIGGPRRVLFTVTPESTEGVSINKLGLTGVEARLKFDQPLNPSTENVPVNVSADPLKRELSRRGRVFLEYDDPKGRNTWIPATVDLETNTLEGSELVLRPVGVLPNNADVRVIVESTLEDMSGESNVSDASYDRVFAMFRTRSEFEPQYDAIVEAFDQSNSVDEAAPFLEPQAIVKNGRVSATFAFEGGDSLLVYEPSAREIILNTDFTQIVPKGAPPINVAGGVFNFREVTIPAGVLVRGVGTKPMVWLVTGDFTVNGDLSVEGGLGARVDTLNSANFATAGGIGSCGGGNGGKGSPNTSDRSPSGESGFGPGQKPGGGGGGGQLSCTAGCNRGSAGGGGSLGTQGDPYYPPTGSQTWPQISGDGGRGCTSKTLPGGAKGARPFVDSRQDNNFWGAGVNVFEQVRIRGELIAPVAGAGGGGGGDLAPACSQGSGFITDNKGGGGGGGAGVLIVKALGKIVIGPEGHITADGGDGGGGEQAGSNNQGGGGGGGSGGMVILMAGEGIEIFVHGTNPLSKATYGELDYNFPVSADGGIGLQGRFSSPEITGKYTPVGTTSWNTNATGGFGGLGIVQLMVPPGDDGDQTGNRLDDNVHFFYFNTMGQKEEVLPARKKALLAWRGWPDIQGVFRDDNGDQITLPNNGRGEGEIRPSPIMLPSPFGAISRARSRWIDTGLTVREPVSSTPGPNTPRVVVVPPPGVAPKPDFSFEGTSTRKSDAGYATYDSTGRLTFPTIMFGGLTELAIKSTSVDSEFDGQPAHLIELQQSSLGSVENRYAHYRVELYDGNNTQVPVIQQGALDYRILGHNDRFLFVEPNATFPTDTVKLRVKAKFFQVVTEDRFGLGPVKDSVPIANVRIGFAFHTDPTEGFTNNRYPDPNNAATPGQLFEYDLTSAAFQAYLQTHRPSFVQWDLLLNNRFDPIAAGNNSGSALTAEMPLPAVDFLVIPCRF